LKLTEPPADFTSNVAVDESGYVYAVKWFPRGTGNPPVALPNKNLSSASQQRIVKIGAASEEMVEVIAANPGRGREEDGQEGNFTLVNVQGLTAAPGGEPLYAVTSAGALENSPRVWRLESTSGLDASSIEATEVGSSTATLKATVTLPSIPLETAYRFEYSADGVNWVSQPVPDAAIGNGEAGGTSSTCPLPKASTCQVSQPIDNLVPNTTYQLRIVLYTFFDQGRARILSEGDFKTKEEPPLVITGSARWSSPAATKPSLLLGGTVNPGHSVTKYYFQYVDESTFQADSSGGDGFQHATDAPIAPGEAGKGLRNVAVRNVVDGLDPDLAYRYRLIATNASGTSVGSIRTVSPPDPGERFYEQVSSGDSWGSGVSEYGIGDVADDGQRALFYAQAFGRQRSSPKVVTGNPFVAQRGADGWSVSGLLPSPSRAARDHAEAVEGASHAADLGAQLWAESSVGESQRNEAQFGRAGIDGSLIPASAQIAPLAERGEGTGFYEPLGASADLSRIVFAFKGSNSAVSLLPGETPPAVAQSNLYGIAGAGSEHPVLEILNRANGPAGAVLGGACGAQLGGTVSTHAVSTDGSVVYFSARPGASGVPPCEEPKPLRLYKRIDGEETVEVSKSTCTRTSPTACNTALDGNDTFWGASANGEVVFFTTKRQLTDSDEDETEDLYAYDESLPPGERLVQVSAGEAVGSHSIGKGAKVQGVVDNSEDGSRVYFVAEGALTGANVLGNSPSTSSGARNLYVWERDAAHPAGRISFVATLLSGDQGEWRVGGASGEPGGQKYATALPVGGGEGDGHDLAIVTATKLLPTVDTDSSPDLYLYDDDATSAAEALRCLSCVGNEESPVRVTRRFVTELSRPDYAQQAPFATRDLSTVVMTTKEALLPADENTTWDVYGWQQPGAGGCTEASSAPARAYFPAIQGCLELLSPGTGEFGIEGGANNVSSHQAAISPDGRDVFFTTVAPLVGEDSNHAADVYDARIGGGFPDEAQASACTAEASCHGVAPSPPTALSPAGSEIPAPGNAPSPKPCGKGKVRKHGKCVRRAHPARKHRHSSAGHRQANHRQGASK
jgi:hypothetical protein